MTQTHDRKTDAEAGTETSSARNAASDAAPHAASTAASGSVELVDVGGGNIGSVMRFLERVGIQYRHVQSPDQLTGKSPLILPGVGNFGAVMQHLRKNGLADAVIDWVRKGTPFLGVCVGMQILFEGSEESPDEPGLGLLKGNVVKFTHGKVPQIGWNQITPQESVRDIYPDQEYVYFVNSFFARLADPKVVSFTAEYFETFCAAVRIDNITAFQFHPEKSAKAGERLLSVWLKEVGVLA